MVDDDGVSISEDKTRKTWKFVVACGEDTKVTPVEYDGGGGSGREGALARGHSGWRRGLEGLS